MKANEFVKKELLIWLMIIAPFAVVALYWQQLPERVPIHWNAEGIPNGYSPKGPGILLLPVLNFIMYFFFLLIPRIDPKKANFGQFEGPFRIIRLVIHTVLSICFVIGLMYAMNYPVNTRYIISIVLPLMFLVLGNFMGKIRPNYFVGVRTPWTLANETVWIKTHRFTGRVWVAASFIDLFINLLFKMPSWVFQSYLAVLIVVPILYSYIRYREL
jgi:uncharacterized membrane protein